MLGGEVGQVRTAKKLMSKRSGGTHQLESTHDGSNYDSKRKQAIQRYSPTGEHRG
jgi:hypothetical protein